RGRAAAVEEDRLANANRAIETGVRRGPSGRSGEGRRDQLQRRAPGASLLACAVRPGLPSPPGPESPEGEPEQAEDHGGP
ncbi:MAG: hypothetical protein O6831_09235, partial [Alphaproteobacteria bacterium]|nr:hypothetical protein [Alphaproteobacteria bacterium]